MANFICTLLPIASLCGPAEPPKDLSIYAGRSPFEEVQGYRLFDVPRVELNLKLYAGSDGRDFIKDLDQATTITLTDGALIVGLCRKDDCQSANAAIALSTDGTLIVVCTFAKEESHGAPEGIVHWAGPQLNQHLPPQPDLACPLEPGALLDRYARLKT